MNSGNSANSQASHFYIKNTISFPTYYAALGQAIDKQAIYSLRFPDCAQSIEFYEMGWLSRNRATLLIEVDFGGSDRPAETIDIAGLIHFAEMV